MILSAQSTPTSAGVINFRVICGYSIFEELHCGQRTRATEISGSVASHSTMRFWAFSKSASSTNTFAFACGRDMKPTCCKGASLWTSARNPASWKRRFSCLALAGSLNVAIVTINLVASSALTRCDQTSTSGQVQDLPSRPWRKPLVKHQVHEHARDRDVKPDWDRPTRDP